MPVKLPLNPFENVEGFVWDKANVDKNTIKHEVGWQEAEEVFGNKPLIVAEDVVHSSVERRYSALGKTNKERKLTIIFTIRGRMIRVISARSQSRNERSAYEQAEKAKSHTRL